jgi:hypothetical protein
MSSKIKPIIRELRQAVLDGMAHSKDKLPELTGNMHRHIDDVVGNVKKNDSFDSNVDVNLKDFKKNKNHDSVEYNRQYNEQMGTLQNMSAADWLRNRVEYLENGRTSDSLRAQQNARSDAFTDKVAELREAGQSRAEAKQNAANWLQGQAATHRLDGIAGGDVTDISGVGDARVNSSLGSQWRSRVGDIDNAIIDFVKNNPGVDLNDVGIEISFR